MREKEQNMLFSLTFFVSISIFIDYIKMYIVKCIAIDNCKDGEVI